MAGGSGWSKELLEQRGYSRGPDGNWSKCPKNTSTGSQGAAPASGERLEHNSGSPVPQGPAARRMDGKKGATQGWITIGGRRMFLRSGWEAKAALWIERMRSKGEILAWFHEPYVFRFGTLTRGRTTYKPDFKIIGNDGNHRWVEVKGYMDAQDKVKLKRMARYHPSEVVEVWDRDWFKARRALAAVDRLWDSVPWESAGG